MFFFAEFQEEVLERDENNVIDPTEDELNVKKNEPNVETEQNENVEFELSTEDATSLHESHGESF